MKHQAGVSRTPMKTLKWLSVSLVGILLLSVFVSGSWIVTDTALQATSGDEFCSLCHTMKPFAEAYSEDIHGGKNPKGLSAACADCHLPHDSRSGYLFAKAKTGIYDVWREMLALFEEPDWIGNLANRERYVYDSGCLRCHSRLQQAENPASPTATFGHGLYFKSNGAMHCVSCHTHVGHKDLLARLSPESEGAGETAAQAKAVQEHTQ